MRAFPRLVVVTSLLVFALPAFAAGSMRTAGFQLQADGLVHSPSGDVRAAGDAALSDRLGGGPGFALTGTLGVRPHLAIGARVSYFGSENDGSLMFTDIVAGVGPFAESRRFRGTAVHGVLQYRHATGKFEWGLEAGAGVLSARERLVLTSANGEKASAVGVQQDASFMGGVSLAWLAGWNSDVVASGRLIGTSTGDGAVWSSGDSPRFTTWSLGVRYPHDTH